MRKHFQQHFFQNPSTVLKCVTHIASRIDGHSAESYRPFLQRDELKVAVEENLSQNIACATAVHISIRAVRC